MIPSWLGDVLPVAIKGATAGYQAIRDRKRPIAERLEVKPRPVNAALRAMLIELEARQAVRDMGAPKWFRDLQRAAEGTPPGPTEKLDL